MRNADKSCNSRDRRWSPKQASHPEMLPRVSGKEEVDYQMIRPRIEPEEPI